MVQKLLLLSAVRFLIGVVLCLLVASGAQANEVDDRLTQIARIDRDVARLAQERRTMGELYDEKVRAVAALKAQPSAWGRDRKLQDLLAESKDMAALLDRKDEELRAALTRTQSEKQALAKAIDAELVQHPSAERQAVLGRERAKLLLTTARRIRLPSDAIEPDDDAEDLEFKAGALAQSEQALAFEERRLRLRAAGLRQQAKLARSRMRVDEQDVFREEEIRGTSKSSARNGGTDSAAAPPPSIESTPPGDSPPLVSTPSSGLSDPRSLDLAADPSVVLADVVASSTVEDLRRAERSGDPEAMARAAERAVHEVTERAQRLHQRRLEMEQRAQKLRGANP